MKNNGSILGVREAARFLGVSPKMLRSWVKSKSIPYIKYPGDMLKFQRDDLVKWQESKTIVPANCEHPVDRRRRKAEEAQWEKAVQIGNQMLAGHYPRQKRKK